MWAAMFTFSRASSTKRSDSALSFPYPITPCPPMAVFPPYFAPNEQALALVSTIAAPIDVIRAIDPSEWMPEFPLIVLSRLDDSLLGEEDRDFIWNTFGVPVFEYLLDGDGRILARECEAHEGLHIERLPESREVEMIEEACACGTPGARLSVFQLKDDADRQWSDRVG
jgi:hypothetical protein